MFWLQSFLQLVRHTIVSPKTLLFCEIFFPTSVVFSVLLVAGVFFSCGAFELSGPANGPENDSVQVMNMQRNPD